MFTAVSGSPREIVGSVVDAYNARDMDGLLACFGDDVVWHTTPGFLWPGPYRGRDAVRELFSHWWQGWSTARVDTSEVEAAGDRVMVSADAHGRSAGDGLDVHVPLNWVLHVSGGVIDLVQSFDSADEARAAL